MTVEEMLAEESATLDGEGVLGIPAIEYGDEPMLADNVSSARDQQHLQQESYHGLTTVVVEPEATEERATVVPEDLMGSDGTLRSTLRVWAGRRGPVAYNMW